MLDMAVGMIVGGAFTALVSSIVSNIATPLIGVLIGIDLHAIEVELPHLYGDGPPNVLGIGLFINNLISFFIVAFTVFLFVKAINRFKKKHEEAPSKPSNQEVLLAEIRDILKDSK